MRIQTVVDLATSEAPPLQHTVDDIVEAGQRVQRRRRLGWASSGVGAAAVIGVTAAVALGSFGGRATPTVNAADPRSSTSVAAADASQSFPVPAPPFAFTFTGYKVGKMRVAAPISVSTAYQIASVYADDMAANDKAVDPSSAPSGPKKPGSGTPTLYAYLTVYQPGAYDPKKLPNAKQVSVGSRSGLYSNGGNPPSRNLAWQYGMNAWAVISVYSTSPDNPSEADLVALAAGLRPATPTVAKVPFTMNYVPAGYKLDEIGTHAMAGLDGIASAEDGDYAGALFSNPALPTTGLSEPFGGNDGVSPSGSFKIFVVPTTNANQKPSAGISCMNGFCNRWADNGKVNIQVASDGRLSNAEMTKILNGIQLGNVNDDSTWTPVTTAIH